MQKSLRFDATEYPACERIEKPARLLLAQFSESGRTKNVIIFLALLLLLLFDWANVQHNSREVFLVMLILNYFHASKEKDASHENKQRASNNAKVKLNHLQIGPDKIQNIW